MPSFSDILKGTGNFLYQNTGLDDFSRAAGTVKKKGFQSLIPGMAGSGDFYKQLGTGAFEAGSLLIPGAAGVRAGTTAARAAYYGGRSLPGIAGSAAGRTITGAAGNYIGGPVGRTFLGLNLAGRVAGALSPEEQAAQQARERAGFGSRSSSDINKTFAPGAQAGMPGLTSLAPLNEGQQAAFDLQQKAAQSQYDMLVANMLQQEEAARRNTANQAAGINREVTGQGLDLGTALAQAGMDETGLLGFGLEGAARSGQQAKIKGQAALADILAESKRRRTEAKTNLGITTAELARQQADARVAQAISQLGLGGK